MSEGSYGIVRKAFSAFITDIGVVALIDAIGQNRCNGVNTIGERFIFQRNAVHFSVNNAISARTEGIMRVVHKRSESNFKPFFVSGTLGFVDIRKPYLTVGMIRIDHNHSVGVLRSTDGLTFQNRFIVR